MKSLRFPPQLIPTSIQFNSYVEAWAMQDFTLYMLNTFKIMLFNIVLCVGVSAFVAYGFFPVFNSEGKTS